MDNNATRLRGFRFKDARQEEAVSNVRLKKNASNATIIPFIAPSFHLSFSRVEYINLDQRTNLFPCKIDHHPSVVSKGNIRRNIRAILFFSAALPTFSVTKMQLLDATRAESIGAAFDRGERSWAEIRLHGIGVGASAGFCAVLGSNEVTRQRFTGAGVKPFRKGATRGVGSLARGESESGLG